MSSDKTAKHPPWAQPEQGELQLNVLNSLTSSKVPFHPHEGNIVKWYACGPTVYDSAHLGHARAYVTFDIIRRILSDYFNYNVFYVMNITDVDDKIIARARRNYLFDKYLSSATDEKLVLADVDAAFAAVMKGHSAKVANLQAELAAAGADKKAVADLEERIKEENMKLGVVIKEKAQTDDIIAANGNSADDVKTKTAKLFGPARSVLMAKLDKEQGDSVDDHSIFNAHSSRYEKEFMEDMKNLGVRDPDVITRVTEYVPQIIKFVEDIIANGFAYESRGSVYFDTVSFIRSGKYHYAKLAPWCVGNLNLLADGEGSLNSGDSEKKNANDFALWKKSKSGEPKWQSPWGEGRPGWHIECSAMASDVLGQQFDIHSGGEDLRFPHHDNEIAQSEAQSGCTQWINYFFHAGHLSIEGLKMSKSLKNFITIRDVLDSYSARTIRLLFLLQSWHDKMMYNEDSLAEAAAKEKNLKEFYLTVEGLFRRAPEGSTVPQLWTAEDVTLSNALRKCEAEVHSALLDNFDYPKAINRLLSLVTDGNKYLAKQHPSAVKVLLLRRVVGYLDRMLRVFGVIPEKELGFIAASAASAGGSGGSGGSNEMTGKVLDVLAEFRDVIRANMMKALNGAVDPKVILALCDKIRDDTLPEIGVRLEDKANAPSIWKLDDPNELIRQKLEKLALAKQNELKKVQNQMKPKLASFKKFEEAVTNPKDLFTTEEEKKKYAQWDEEFTPTHDANNEPLSKSLLKKLKKQTQVQQKAHEEYVNKLQEDPEFLSKLKKELDDLAAREDALSKELAGQEEAK